MRHLLLLISLFIWLQPYSQTYSYKFSDQIDSMMRKDSVPWRYQRAAWDYSYIGEYQAALKAMNDDDLIRLKQVIPSKTQLKPILEDRRKFISAYKPVAAEDYIIDEAKKTNLIIINEAHHIPRHRVFVERLLLRLYNLGYRFLGVETLNSRDTLLNQRKYPILTSGSYSKESSFGNLIRTAFKYGFSVFSYEATGNIGGKQREIQQAEKIKIVMDKNPDAKFIIYCGFDHAVEDSMNNSWGYAMAGRIRKITGINPLTIDQVQLTETGNTLMDNPFRQVIKLDYSAVFINDQVKAFNNAATNKAFDVNVYHPSTKMVTGRPDWLQGWDRTEVDVVSKITIECPCIIMAYRSEDNVDQAVPVDIMELMDKKETKKMILNKTVRHTIVVRNKAGQTEKIEID